jgi:hypothetical protein
MALALVVVFALPATAYAAPGWYSPVNVSPTPAGSQAFNPDVSVDGTGRAIAVWVKNDGVNDRVQAAVRPAGALSFGTIQTISPLGQNAFEPHVANAPTGEAVAVWTNTSLNQIQSSYKAANTDNFAPLANVATISSSPAFHPQVSMDPQGNVEAIWSRTMGSDTIIEAAFQPSGGAFAAPEQLSQNGSPQTPYVSDNPQIAAEQNGGASAVWTRFDGSTAVVQTSARRELNFPRPGGGSPLRVPLVPEYRACTSPNSNHIAPLNNPSCTSVVADSSLLTTSNTGAGSGFVRYDAVPGNANPATNDADMKIVGNITDVRCVGISVGCVLAGDDYTGQVIFTSVLRTTDLSNGVFGDDPGTVQDTEFSVPATCVTNPLGTVGSTCAISTSTNALFPDYVRERRRNLIEIASVNVKDAGADGSVVPPSGTCPRICGSGDERVYQRQGLFTP